RCFTCGALIADKWEEYKSRVDAGESPAKVLDELGIKRYCCRRMFVSAEDYFDEVVEFRSKFGKRGDIKA
ncbi:MAG: DNA-directed RNA polymerase subunit N, partial [Nitrososphaerota archaeon]